MQRDRSSRRAARQATVLAAGAVLALSTALITAGCAGAPTVTAPPSLTDTAAPSSTAEAAPTTRTEPSGSGEQAGGGGGAPPANPGGPVPCRAGTLSVTLGPGGGAAGTIYAPLRFSNKGSRPCVIQGFAGVSYVTGDNGTQVGPAAEREGVKGAPVTLAPGAVASASLAMVQVLNYDESVCRPTPTRGLRVYPPGDTASVFVPVAGTGCAGSPPGPQLRISTIKAGPGER
ncbi:MAG: hypothetical protein QOD96_5204 [Pseudonocardiales bacterium]|nr:hypothetical protein [Pseudonocardiales bacterium]